MRNAIAIALLSLLATAGCTCDCGGRVTICAGDDDCQAGTYCVVGGTCEVVACAADADCAGLGYCIDGRCNPTECLRDDHCDAAEVCRREDCRPSCVTSETCASGLRCVDGACVPPFLVRMYGHLFEPSCPMVSPLAATWAETGPGNPNSVVDAVAPLGDDPFYGTIRSGGNDGNRANEHYLLSAGGWFRLHVDERWLESLAGSPLEEAYGPLAFAPGVIVHFDYPSSLADGAMRVYATSPNGAELIATFEEPPGFAFPNGPGGPLSISPEKVCFQAIAKGAPPAVPASTMYVFDVATESTTNLSLAYWPDTFGEELLGCSSKGLFTKIDDLTEYLVPGVQHWILQYDFDGTLVRMREARVGIYEMNFGWDMLGDTSRVGDRLVVFVAIDSTFTAADERGAAFAGLVAWDTVNDDLLLVDSAWNVQCPTTWGRFVAWRDIPSLEEPIRIGLAEYLW